MVVTLLITLLAIRSPPGRKHVKLYLLTSMQLHSERMCPSQIVKSVRGHKGREQAQEHERDVFVTHHL